MRTRIVVSVLFSFIMYSCQSHRFMQFGQKWNYETVSSKKLTNKNDTIILENLFPKLNFVSNEVDTEIDSTHKVISSINIFKNSKTEEIVYKREAIQLENSINVHKLICRKVSDPYLPKATNLSNTNTNLQDSKMSSPIVIISIIYGSLLLVGLFFYLHLVKGYSIAKSILLLLWQLLAFFICGYLFSLFLIQLFQSII